jgi:hypothetical protein
MLFYRLINLWLLLLIVVLFCTSCSERGDNSDSGTRINIFRIGDSKVDQQYNQTRGGSNRPEIAKMSKSLKDTKYDNDNETLFGYLAAVIGFIFLIVLALICERYLAYRIKIAADSPSSLFFELCVAHQLTRIERNIIERVARSAGIDDPLPIFIEPNYLQNAVYNNAFKDAQQNIEYLLAKLFESKSESSIIKRSSILLQSELESGSKIEDSSSSNNIDATESTIAYPPKNS